MKPRLSTSLLLLAGILRAAPSVNITSPANGAVVNTITVPFNVAITGTTAQASVEYFLDGRLLEPYGRVQAPSSSGPWSTTWYPGLAGDSYGMSLYAVVKDIAGNVLAISPTITVSSRLMGTDAFFVGVSGTLSGTSRITVAETHPRPPGGGTGQIIGVDGRTDKLAYPWGTDYNGYVGTGVNGLYTDIDTRRFRNGDHEIYFEEWQGFPYNSASSQTFAPGAINTTTHSINLPYHALINATDTGAGHAGVVTFTSTGSCPAGLTCDGATLYYVVNASYSQSLSDTIQVSTTPGGSPVTISTQGSGTHSIAYKLPNPYWCAVDPGQCPVTNGSLETGVSAPYSHRRKIYTFDNGAAHMEMRAPIDECFGTPGSTCLTAPTIYNTDMSTTALAANAVTYTITSEGGVSGCATVNSTSGIVTFANPLPASPCFATLDEHCPAGACAGLPDIHIRLMAQTANIFPTFAKNGSIKTAYDPAQSLIIRTMWHMDSGKVLNIPWLGQLALDSGINTLTDSYQIQVADPSISSCSAATNSFESYRSVLRSVHAQYGFSLYLLQWGFIWPPWFMDYLTNNIGWDRQACLKMLLGRVVSDGFSTAIDLQDETNGLLGNYPTRNGKVGQSNYFQRLVVNNNVGTLTVHADYLIAWDQVSGHGDWISLSGSSTPALNGLYKINNVVINQDTSIYTSQFTIVTNGVPSGTYDISNDGNLELFIPSPSGISGFGQFTRTTIPGREGSGTTQQNWDSNFTSMVSNGSTLTVHWTGCCSTGKLTTGRIMRIWNATNTSLHNAAVITRVDDNTFTMPTAAAANTYSSVTDPNLYLTLGPVQSNAFFTQVIDILNAVPGRPALTTPILGQSINPAQVDATKNYLGNRAISDFAEDYGTLNAAGLTIYGIAESYFQEALESYAPIVGMRAYQLEPRKMLFGVDQNIIQTRREWILNLATDRPTLLNFRGQGQFMMRQLAGGITGFRGYNFMSSPADQYNTTIPISTEIALRHDTIPHLWNSMALAFQLMARLEKYWLQPRMNSPSYGSEFFTAAHQADNLGSCSTNCGRVLLVGSLMELPRTETIDFTGFRYTGGTIRRYSLTSRNLSMAMISGAATSETYTFNSTDPGEVIAYVFQPSGTAPDIDTLTFPAPASLPAGASKFFIKLGYYPGAIDDADGTDCTSGCTIVADRSVAPVWTKYIYTASDNTIRFSGDAQRFLPK